MNFSEKLQLIRKSKGFTQEELAGILCVSRQAVAKWELGQAYPDIANLIRLSEISLVTVDYLVKDDGCQKNEAYLLLGHREITDFLIRAQIRLMLERVQNPKAQDRVLMI
ncbi:MAG: helix-turn-helix transcriptional regulator [Ethanoligenens sp.]